MEIKEMTETPKVFVCPTCNHIGGTHYLSDSACPYCGYLLSSADMIYMPTFQDAYELAQRRVLENEMKRNGFEINETDSI